MKPACFTPRLLSLLISLVLNASFAWPAIAGTQPIVTNDLLRIREVTAIDVSRDGSKAVYAVKSIAEVVVPPTASAATKPATSQPDRPTDRKDNELARRKWHYQSHLFLFDLTSPDAQPRQLTFGGRFDGSPKLSPDGRRVAFVRSAARSDARPQNGERHESPPQVWIMPIDGGEAWQLTDLASGCSDPQWSPDGQRVLISAEVTFRDLAGARPDGKQSSPAIAPPWPGERPKRNWNDVQLPGDAEAAPAGTREQIRAWLEDNALDNDPIVITRLEFHDELSLRGEMKFSHLYLFDVPSMAGSTPPLSIDRARRVTNGFFDHIDPAFIPDGSGIVYAAKKPDNIHPDRVLSSDIWRINLDGGNDHKILALDGWALSSPKPSRDGAVMAFLAARIDEPAFRQRQLGMASLQGTAASDPLWLTEESTFLASVRQFEWMALQPGLVFTAPMRGGFPLMTITQSLLQPATLIGEEDGQPIGVGAFASGGGAIVCSVTSTSNPCVLKVRDGRGVRVAHDLNEWVKDKNISLPVAGEITRPDGLKVQHWLMEPTNREPGKKYPLCLQMHGGPDAMWGPGEATMWHEFQLLCSWGYGVAYCNPRGSGGYGYAFQKANFQDWGEGPAGDVLAVVDHALNREWVDPERLTITGGSYAGYLTAWIIAHDHRFKAAVAQRGVYDLNTFFGEGNAWRLVQEAFGGNPYEARMRDVIARNNPFGQVTKIRTPLLIMHSSNDLRTGVSQSEMLYRALKELNKDVEYVRYPHSGHELSRSGDPRQRMDRLNRIIEFFERYIENPRGMPATR